LTDFEKENEKDFESEKIRHVTSYTIDDLLFTPLVIEIFNFDDTYVTLAKLFVIFPITKNKCVKISMLEARCPFAYVVKLPNNEYGRHLRNLLKDEFIKRNFRVVFEYVDDILDDGEYIALEMVHNDFEIDEERAFKERIEWKFAIKKLKDSFYKLRNNKNKDKNKSKK